MLPSFFFSENYSVIVTTNFSRCCGWLRFAAQPKLLFFTLRIQTFVLPYNNDASIKRPLPSFRHPDQSPLIVVLL